MIQCEKCTAALTKKTFTIVQTKGEKSGAIPYCLTCANKDYNITVRRWPSIFTIDAKDTMQTLLGIYYRNDYNALSAMDRAGTHPNRM